MNTNFSKGSEWRKWDLHVHTPFSYLNNQFGNDFDKFVSLLFKKALEKDIASIGITDYFTIEGYKKLKNEYLNNDEKIKILGFEDDEIKKIRRILFLPNVEFRLNKLVGSSRINFHVIFSDKVSVEDIEENFLREIKFVYEGTPQNKDEQRALTILNLEDLGKKLKKEHPEFINKSDIEVGMMTAVVDDKDILEVLSNKRSIFEGKYLTFVPADEDLSKISWDSQDHNVRKVIIQKSDGFFSANENTIKFGLGKKHESVEEYLKEFKTFKPCIWGSDAHSFDKLFEPEQKRYTWIKADLTFEGLKQVIYEPEERVFIGEKPELLSRIKNNTTKYITSLKINQIQGYNDSKQIWFKDIDIPINPSLVCIIGNRGSGKSALVDIIGLCGNSHLYEEFSFLNKDRFCKDNLSGNFEATLHWLSENDIINKKLNELTDKNAPERVRYLPQSFFERLTNNLDHYEFNKTIEQVVFSYIPKEERLGKNNFEELLNFKKEQNEKEIKNKQNYLEGLNKKIIELEKKLLPSYRQQIEEKKKLKEKELEEHNKNKPNEIPNPENDPTISEEVKSVQSELNKLNKLLNDTNDDIYITQNQRDSLRLSIEEIETIKKELNNFEKDINDFINKNTDKLKNQHGINLNEIINININYRILDDKISELKKEYESAKIKLTDPVEISDIIKKENIEKQSLIFKRKNIEKQINDLKSKLSEPQRKYQEYLEQLQKWESIKNQIEGNEQIVDSLKWLNKEIDYLANTLKQDIENLRELRLEISKDIYNINKKYIDLYTSFKNNTDKNIKDFESIMGEYKINIDVSLKMDNSFYENFLQYINQRFKGSFYGIDEGKKMLLSLLEGKNINEDQQFISVLKKKIEYLEEDKRDGITGEKTRYISDQILNEKKWLEFYNYLFSLQYINPEYKLTLGGKDITQLSPGERGALLIVFYLLLDKDDIPLIIDQPEENLDNESVYKILRHFIVHAKRNRQIIMVTHNPNLAIVGDAEQIIFVNIDKKNGNQFSFESGSIENPKINKHASDILEGTLKAFDIRKIKYFRSED